MDFPMHIPEELKNMLEELAKRGMKANEVYGRFALLQLGLMNIKNDFITPLSCPEFLHTEDEYMKCKLAVGTALMAAASSDLKDVLDLQSSQLLYHIKARAIEKDWTLSHNNTKKIPTLSALVAIDEVFTEFLGGASRPCDARIVIQMSTPRLWNASKIGDHVLFHPFHERSGEESQRLADFGTTLDIDRAVFANELRRYLEEHIVKKNLNSKAIARIRKSVRENM